MGNGTDEKANGSNAGLAQIEAGYYWVRQHKNSRWEVAHFHPWRIWYFCGNPNFIEEGEVFEIGNKAES